MYVLGKIYTLHLWKWFKQKKIIWSDPVNLSINQNVQLLFAKCNSFLQTIPPSLKTHWPQKRKPVLTRSTWGRSLLTFCPKASCVSCWLARSLTIKSFRIHHFSSNFPCVTQTKRIGPLTMKLHDFFRSRKLNNRPIGCVA